MKQNSMRWPVFYKDVIKNLNKNLKKYPKFYELLLYYLIFDVFIDNFENSNLKFKNFCNFPNSILIYMIIPVLSK